MSSESSAPGADSLYEGRQEKIRELELPPLETFANIYSDREYTVEFTIPEFTCVCPKTGLPDFATLTIRYEPREFCVELKSFKMYLLAFRDIGIFHENAANRISDDLIALLKPAALSIEGVFNARGGIATTVRRDWRAE